jgi:hypothetical protein
MAIREGKQGSPLWPVCFELGVAAIQYDPVQDIDLSKYPQSEPHSAWSKLENTQKASLRRVAYEMQKGDIIYLRDGKRIVSRGTILGSYQFISQSKIIDSQGTPWQHQIPVEWDVDFPEVENTLGSDQVTVKLITPDQIERITASVDNFHSYSQKILAREGEVYMTEAAFRSRNRSLIEAKKLTSEYICEICGFSFEKIYGTIGSRYIIAHHRTLIANGPTTNTLDDIALVCANCHAMLHTENPPMSVEELRQAIESTSRNKRRVKG